MMFEPPRAATARTETPGTGVYRSRRPWKADLPRTLVVCCSDGRLNGHTEEFLEEGLGLENYDRVYVPGGPGGLAGTASEYLRADQFRRECMFLVQAHGIHDVVLIVHGAAEGGPDEAVCGDYDRKFSGRSKEEIRQAQDTDVTEVLRSAFAGLRGMRLRAFRAEVLPDMHIQFVPLNP